MSDSKISQERGSSPPAENVQREEYNLEPVISSPQSSVSSVAVETEQNSQIAVAEKSLPTIGQLMRATAQSVQRLYRTQLGHSPSRVTRHMVADKLSIWAEISVTHIEKLLYQFDDVQLESVRAVIDSVCRPQLIDIVEEKLGVKVITLVSDTCYDQECTGLIVALSDHPQVRSSRNATFSSSR